jgi:hypothetical protein
MLLKRARPAPQGDDTLRQLIASLAIGGADIDPGFSIPGPTRDVDLGFSIPGPSRDIDPGFTIPRAGPPAPPIYDPTQMIGRDDSEGKGPGFMKDMGPMLIAGLADLISTEGMRQTGGVENNPLLPKVGGSVAPAMGIGTLLQSILYHKLGKKRPGLANILKTQQTATSGTLAGQNFAQVRGRAADRDDRLSVWGAGR